MATTVPPRRDRRRLRPGVTTRMTLACLLVLALAAGVGALVARNEVGALQSALSAKPSLNVGAGVLAPSGWGDPQTLLLVGDDQRKHTTTTPVLPHSNEMLLVRIDPGKPWISMMSIPRELWVPIQAPTGTITTRLNYAYTAGGISLMVQTIKQVLGLPVNHVIVIDFNHFQQAVNEIGCVYSTVDRRYFHVNTPGSQQYQEVNLEPGYQKLCGAAALQYVSYRHGDTSLVRDARDQSFLLDVKKQYGPTLVGNIHTFERIFGRTVQTDPTLHTSGGILNLLGTLISSGGLRVRQVHFQAKLLPTYDTATPKQIAASVHSFLYGADRIPSRATAAVAHAVHPRRGTGRLPLVAEPPAVLGAARTAAARLPFLLEFPRVRLAGAPAGPVDLSRCPADAVQVTCLRTYLIRAPGGTVHPAYAVVQFAGQLGQFYDVQGTTWTAGPQFASPDQRITVVGRRYELYYDGPHLKTVAWFEHGAVYWIHNTLLDSVGNGEMLAMAEQTAPVASAPGATRYRPGRPGAQLRAAAVPTRVSATRVTTGQELESIAGLLTLLSAPVLLGVYIRRRLRVRRVRASVVALEERQIRLAAALEAMGARGAPLAAPIASGAPAPAPIAWGTAESARHARLVSARRSVARPLTARRAAALAGVVAALAVAGVLGAVVLSRTHSGRRPARAAATRRAPSVPTLPVAVLNATASAGAAHRLAVQLGDRGVRVAGTGNVAVRLAPGLDILYAAGDRAQALELAQLLAVRSSSLNPMTAATSSAAGGAHLAVVIA